MIKGILFLLGSYINLDGFAEEICDIDGREALSIFELKSIYSQSVLLALISVNSF